MNAPLVSVIVPNYNYDKFLKKRFDSIINQAYENLEIILLDDNSTDGSKKLLKEFRSHPKVTHLKINQKNVGSPFKQWKKGLDLAKGRYVWIAESDDWADKLFLKTGVSLLIKYNADLFTCNSFLVDQDDKKIGTTQDWSNFLEEPINVFDGKLFIKNYQIHNNYIYNASATIFRKKLYDSINPEFTDFKQSGDYFFWSSLLLQGKLIYYKSELNYWRKHKQSVSSMNSFKHNIYENCKIFSFLRKELKLNSILPIGVYQRLIFYLKNVSITENLTDVIVSIYYLLHTDIRILKIMLRDSMNKFFR